MSLACKADPALYDHPLTLVTRVPAGWKQCQVTQGKAKSTVPAVQGEIQYDARPGAGDVTIQPQAR